MNKFLAAAAIAATTLASSPASAQAGFSVDAAIANIQLQCATSGTLASCDTLIQNYLNSLMGDASFSDSQRANAIARLVEAATSALNTSTGSSNAAVSTELEQIIGGATEQLNTIKARSPDAAAAVNSAVSRATVAVLTVVQEKSLTDDAGSVISVVAALEDLADTSTDNTQSNAIDDIAAILEVGGSIVDVIEEIEVVNSYASPA